MMNIYINNFNICLLQSSKNQLFSSKGTPLRLILSNNRLLSWNPTVILADPFLFVYRDVLFLFYERQDRWLGKGKICMQKTSDLKNWSDEKTVLEEPFHLSFPFVFCDGGHIYMIPETGADGSVRLYESKGETLEHWELKTKLLDDGCEWVDSSIVVDDGKYYLFTSKEENGIMNQYLFVSDSLVGQYEMHPSSPIYKGNDYGRNAGSIIKCEGILYRMTQKCTYSYGENVSVLKINQLTSDVYQESLYREDILEKDGLWKNGGHQYNCVNFKNDIIVATDFRTRNYNIIEFFRRVKKHLAFIK